MALTSAAAGAPAGLEALAARARPVSLAEERRLPVLPALQPLLPGQGLRRGTTVAVAGSTSLALALVAASTAAGSAVGIVGLPDLGFTAAAGLGVVLERVLLVPSPGKAWATVVATLLDACEVVLAGMPPRSAASQARRLSARARERRAVLVPLESGQGGWPEVDLRLAVAASSWEGLGDGHGRLLARRLEVVARGRGAAAREQRTWLWLPDRDGGVGPAEPLVTERPVLVPRAVG